MSLCESVNSLSYYNLKRLKMTCESNTIISFSLSITVLTWAREAGGVEHKITDNNLVFHLEVLLIFFKGMDCWKNEL